MDFLNGFFKNGNREWLSVNPPKEETMKSMEQKNQVFYQIDVQEFDLRTGLLFAFHLKG
jgi:hypothetical protein